jgi:phosphate-selective porin OprO/OprP
MESAMKSVVWRCALAIALCNTPYVHAQTSEPRLTASDPTLDTTAPPDNSATAISPQGSTEATKGKSAYEKIWQFSELYQNDRNRLVQKVLFTGRYHHEYSTTGGDERHADEWNVRRMRLGSRVTWLQTMVFHGEVEFNPQEANPLYLRFTDMYAQWNKSARLSLTAGKQAVPFTMDGSTSTKELMAIDRSNLSNNLYFPQEFTPGVSVAGKLSPWVYRAGVYSAGRANREFGEFNGGLFGLSAVGYDFAKALGVREALLVGNYVYQEPDSRNTFTRPLEHIGSVNFKMDAGRWGVRSDVSAGTGFLGQSDLWGVMAMPFINITNKLQGVGRYTFVQSQDVNGVRFATYEDRVVSGRGDRYNELYLGANYFFYGHQLKLQTGVQFAHMRDRANDGGAYSGVSWTTGMRVGW